MEKSEGQPGIGKRSLNGFDQSGCSNSGVGDNEGTLRLEPARQSANLPNGSRAKEDVGGK